jgi:hypothetical protein
MASVFTSPSPHASPPATPSLGLLRWLHLIATKDWAREPLVVPYPPHTAASTTTTTTTTTPTTLDASSAPTHLPTPARLALLEHFRRVRRGESGKANASSSAAAAAAASSQITGPPMYIVLAPAPTVSHATTAGAGEEGGEEEGGEGEGGGSSGGTGAGSAITATVASRAAIRVPWFKPLWTRSDPSIPVLSALVDLARTGYTQLLQGLTTLAHAPPTAAAAVAAAAAPAAGRKGGKKEGGMGRGVPHRAFIGEAKGTQLWGGVSHSEGSATATPTTPPLPALLYPGDDFAPRYHAWLSIAPHLIPRCAMDGRFMGPVATPSYSSLALANLPALLASRLTLGGEEEGEEGGEERRSGGASSGSGAGAGAGVKGAGSKSFRPALVLAVPTVSATAAAAAAAAGGDTTQLIPGAPRPPIWSPPIPCPGTLPWLGAQGSSSSSASSLGVSGGSHFTLSLHTNLLPASRKALLPGFDPLEHYLFTLRSAPGVGGGTLLFPRVRFSGGGVGGGGGGFSAGVGVVARKVGGEQPVLLAPTLALAGELGAGYLDRGGIEEDE